MINDQCLIISNKKLTIYLLSLVKGEDPGRDLGWRALKQGLGVLSCPEGQITKCVDVSVWTLQHPMLGIDIGLKRAGYGRFKGGCRAFGKVGGLPALGQALTSLGRPRV